MRRRIEEGRWRPVGAAVEAFDTLLPSPESIVRQILYGQRWFARELGRDERRPLPARLLRFPGDAPHPRRARRRRRLLDPEAAARSPLARRAAAIPFALGRWRGRDGSELIAALDPGEYGAPVESDLSRDAAWLERFAALEREGRPPRLMLYTGCGDRGGGLPERSLARLERSLASDGPIEVRNSGSESLFDELEPAERERLPVYEGELLLRQHGTGCYSAKGALKRWNRANERLARAAEAAAAVARAFAGRPAPRRRLERAWWRFLTHQMHDDLTGTSIPAAYEISLADEAIAANEFAELLLDSLAALARELDLSGPGRPIVVFNPLGGERTDLVEVLLPQRSAEASPPWVVGPDGAAVPAQWSRVRGETALVFVARVPAAGCAVFHLLETPAEKTVLVRADPETLENERLQARFDAEGRLAGLLDRELGRELLAAPVELERFANRSRKYPAWEILWSDLAAGPLAERPRRLRAEVVEQGPARVALEIERELEGLRCVELWSLAAGAAGDRLECAVTLDSAAPATLLKSAFRFAAQRAEAAYDSGLGAIRRPLASEGLYEVPAQQWAAIEDERGGFGAAVLSEVKAGWDHPDPATLRLTWLHAPAASHKWRHQRTQDFGRHRFRLALTGFAGEATAAAVPGLADRFANPLLAFAADPASANRPGSKTKTSLLSVEGKCLVQAIKPAEDGDRLVVRLRNPLDLPVKARIRASSSVSSFEALDGRERPLETERVAMARREDEAFAISVGACGLATLGVDLASAPAAERHPRTAPLPLQWNLSAFASRDECSTGRGFDDRGRFFPFELRPELLEETAVPFDLSHVGRGAGDALSCRGQVVELPEGAEEVWLLAASVGGEMTARFLAGEREHEIFVPDWRAPLFVESRWSRSGLGSRLLDEIVRRVPVAWVAPFLRDRRGRDLLVEPALLFQLQVPVAGEKSLRLADRPRLRVVAATVAFGPARPLREASPLLF